MENCSISSLIFLLLIFVILCLCQSDAEGIRIQVSLMKAVCSQTQEFVASNHLQSAIKAPTKFSKTQDENCRLVSCKRLGGKCTDIAIAECKKSSGISKPKMAEKTKSQESKNTETRVRYDGYKAYEMTPQNEVELQKLVELQNSWLKFFREPTVINRTAVALVPPEKQEEFSKVSGIQMKETISDVQAILDAEIVKSSSVPGVITWDAYYNLNDVYAFVDKIAQDHPDTAKVVHYGKSFEGRDLKAIVIKHPTDKKPKLAFIIECTLHAREWITTAVCTYLINDLLNEKKSCAVDFLKSWDFYIMPVTNPDGYEFTHTGNRLWRKTRSKTSANESGLCIGADPNRNFDFHWGGYGASASKCDETYRGSQAHSEAEVKHLVEFCHSMINSERVGIYLSIHSFSQFILWPYAHTTSEVIPETAFYNEAGQKIAAAFAARYGTVFQYGPAAITLYPAPGISADYFYATLLTNQSKPTLGMAWEMRDLGRHGFDLPADQIVPSALETIDAFCSTMTLVQPEKKPTTCTNRKLARRKTKH